MRVVRAHFLVALVSALLVLPACAASAGAFSLQSVHVATQDPPATGPNAGPLPAAGSDAAGAHPNLVVTLDFSDAGDGGADSVEGFTMHLAPGIVSYVNHVARCSTADFGPSSGSSSSCAAGSIVGSTTTQATTQVLGPINAPLSLSGTIYNIDPPAGSPAALGIDIVTPVPGQDIKLIATIGVDPHDLGLTATLHGLPNTASGALSAHIDSITQTLFGYVGGASFFTNPTACIPAPVTVDAVSHAGAASSNSGSYTPTDCEHEPFSTSLEISANPPITDSPSEISAEVKPGPADIPRVSSHVKSDTVTLPPGVLINPALAARLDACTDAQFAQSDTSVPATCPPSSAVGDITFVSPILGAFPGKAYFGSQTPTDRLRLFLDVPLYGAHIKVSAHVHPSFTTGQITTVFDELPQIAFTDFELLFHGGPQSALVTPTTCGTHTATATVFPWSGGPPSDSSASFSVSFDGKGAACQRIFQPSMTTSVSDRHGGASPSFTLTADRPDRNVPVGRMTFNLPAGLVGNLALPGLTKCPLADAAVAHCPASSRLGSVSAVAGSGSQPPTLPGSVYLTAPKAAGDPAGLSVVVPAHLGPVDAGIVIVGVRLQLRSDGGLLATSDPIPALQEGIPLALRTLTVTIDRKGFMRNPSSCGEKKPTGHFDAIGGGGAEASSTLTFTDCDKLRFAPKITARLGAKGSDRVGGHPPFTTTITSGAADATIHRAHVVLPPALATNTTALNAACPQTSFDAGTCSKHAQVATARALSPLISGVVSGPVYLVKQAQGLPKLVVQLRTPIAITFTGFVNIGKRGRIGTTFNPVPDLPITRFSLSFHGGRYGVLAANRNLCKGTLRLPSQFTGANGRSLKMRPKIKLIGCRHGRRGGHR